jgi:opacity protein-like surface antigen
MKHAILISLFCTLLGSVAYAQVAFGLKAGPMLSNIVTRDLDTLNFDKTDPKVSYLLGAFVNIPVADKLSLQGELLYANKGRGRFDREDLSSNLHYLSLPVLLQYEVLNGLRVGLGPEVSYLIHAGGTRFIEDWDIALNVGANYAFTEHWLIDLRYNMGIYDISEPLLPLFGSIDPVLSDLTTRNRSVQLTLGYRFK